MYGRNPSFNSSRALPTRSLFVIAIASFNRRTGSGVERPSHPEGAPPRVALLPPLPAREYTGRQGSRTARRTARAALCRPVEWRLRQRRAGTTVSARPDRASLERNLTPGEKGFHRLFRALLSMEQGFTRQPRFDQGVAGPQVPAGALKPLPRFRDKSLMRTHTAAFPRGRHVVQQEATT